MSGYGAGVYSPGWYEHLWNSNRHAILESWMTRVARLMRLSAIRAKTVKKDETQEAAE